MFRVEDFKDMIIEEANKTIGFIGANIFKNKQKASGRSILSLHSELKGNDLIIWGREGFDVLEKGNPPGTKVSIDILYQWAKDKDLPFKNDTDRFWFAKNTSRIIDEKGTLLFRKGGRKDVYTSEIEPLEKRITQRITDNIINEPILDK